ncbi:MAG: acetate kinase [Eubacteriales bacterium]|nr:acetate kinase [bacterium]MDY2792336.1 acetate kinase [Eubacteriales bacterium]
MKILVINAGSSSLKYQLIDMQDESVIAKGLVERIGIEGSKLTHKYDGKEFELTVPMKDHSAAMKHVLDALMDAEHGVIKSIDEIGAVGHRVLHGGDKFTASCIIDQPCLDAIEECIPLGPLHNPANLMGIRACQSVMPGTPMVAVFDTAFHQTMPKTAYMYGVPYEFYEKYHIRRYGFHGTSHRFVSARAIELLGLKGKESKIIVCHLGNGSSLSAVVNGKCVDTSMGLTPLEGVLMGTRSGDLDPAVVECIANNEHLTPTETLNLLNKKSGLMGLSGVSSDMRDVYTAAEAGNERAQMTLDIWAYRVKKYIGAYAAAMGGLDAVIFTAGIGENDKRSRASVCEGLEFMGIKLDPEKNNIRGVEAEISAADSKVKVWVIPTNEELAIARDTLELVSK